MNRKLLTGYMLETISCALSSLLFSSLLFSSLLCKTVSFVFLSLTLSLLWWCAGGTRGFLSFTTPELEELDTIGKTAVSIALSLSHL